MRLDFLPDLAVAFILSFARIGTLVMLLPGLGERAFPTRVRLAAALLIVLVLFPLSRPAYPSELRAPEIVLPLLFEEIAVGFVLGITGRFLLTKEMRQRRSRAAQDQSSA